MINLASDHAGFDLKEAIKKYLLKNKFKVKDFGTFNRDAVAWSYYGAMAAKAVSDNFATQRGIIVCGSGIGMSMVCNKFKNVRAALCHDKHTAELSRKHNNANILNLGARILEVKTALEIVEIWLKTKFEGGRHQQRLDLMSDIENQNFK